VSRGKRGLWQRLCNIVKPLVQGSTARGNAQAHERLAGRAEAVPSRTGTVQNGVVSHQPITTELCEWILAQSAAGQTEELLVEAMLASGWSDGAARLALQTVAERGPAAVGAASAPGVRVPDPLRPDGSLLPHASDREVQVLMALAHPRVVVFANLLSAEECAELIELARSRLARSETVESLTGSSAVNAARSSEGMFFLPAEFPVCARLEARMAALLGWPLENGEGLQILRYGPGAEYKPHYDYFDPVEPGTPTILQRGGQRVASLVCYLNTPEAGGATVFPDAGLEVAPVRGNAVFFSYDRAHPSTRTLHGGAPVSAGEKWVATKWMREGRFE
jgi:prolyl 4-hydroxylase